MAAGKPGGADSRGGAGQGKGEGTRGSRDYFEALKEIKASPDSRNLWMLETREPYLYDRLSKALIQGVVPVLQEFNLAVVYCVSKPEDAAMSCLRNALSELEELPIGRQQRLVILRDVHNLPEPGLTRLTASLSNLPPSTVLLLSGHHSLVPATSGGGRPAGGGRQEQPGGEETEDRNESSTHAKEERAEGAKAYRHLLDIVAASGGLVNGTLSADQTKWNGEWIPGERTNWVKRIFREHLHLKVADDVLRLFVERVGEDMYALLHEAEKLASFKGHEQQVTQEDLRKVVSANPTHQVWELSEAIARRDAGQALQVLTEMLGLGKGGDEVFVILGYLGSHYRNLLRVKALKDRGESPAGAMRLLKARSEWKVKKDMEVAARLSEAELERTLESLLRVDQAIKTGTNGRLALEMAIVGLCEPASGSR